jgi:hypothetical protein
MMQAYILCECVMRMSHMCLPRVRTTYEVTRGVVEQGYDLVYVQVC